MNKTDPTKINTVIKQLKPIQQATLHHDFRELIDYAAYHFSDRDAFIIKTKTGKHDPKPIYEHITYADLKRDMIYLGTEMKNLGLRGKRFAIIGANSYEWFLAHLTIQCGIGISVPLDKGLPYDELVNSLDISHSEVLIYDEKHRELAEKLKAEENTSVTHFISMKQSREEYSIPQMIHDGGSAIYNGDNSFRDLPVDGKKVSILLFTSGTTSQAKAVMLTQYNITSNVYSLQRCEDFNETDVNMAFLPYHHTFGSTGQMLMLACGATTVFCDGLRYIQKNMVEYGVSTFIGVPLLVEAMYKKMMTAIRRQGPEKVEQFEKGLTMTGRLAKVGIDVRRRVFKEVIDGFGGNLRLIISGASALDPVAARGFNAVGIRVYQGLGLTEASPVITGENPKNRAVGSVGRAIYGVQVALYDEDEEGVGEIICRGPNIMKGYYQNPEATADALAGGWLHTGDYGRVDKRGFLYVCGRKKNVIVLKNGKNVYPEELEALIDDLPYVKENIVVGRKRHKNGDHKDLVLCAKIVYDKEILTKEYGCTSLEEIKSVVRRDLDAISDELPNYKRIMRFELTEEEMEKTTTGKIRRYAQKDPDIPPAAPTEEAPAEADAEAAKEDTPASSAPADDTSADNASVDDTSTDEAPADKTPPAAEAAPQGSDTSTDEAPADKTPPAAEAAPQGSDTPEDEDAPARADAPENGSDAQKDE
ncbi:MAG: AMP-binding protein [Anaerovoracaceae bacterium]